MLKYTIKKLLLMIPMMLLISVFIFFGIKATGVDPINYLVTPDMAANPAGAAGGAAGEIWAE